MVSLINILASGAIDSDGNPVSGGSVTFYEAGTTTKTIVYQERELENAHPNPATLDSAGRLIAFSSERLKLVISDSEGTTVSTIDNVGFGSGIFQSSDIADGAVTASDIASGAFTSAKIATASVTTAKLQSSSVTSGKLQSSIPTSKLAAFSPQVSNSCGTVSTTNTSYAAVANLSCTLTTTGRPVICMIVPDGTNNVSSMTAVTSDDLLIGLYVDGNAVQTQIIPVTGRNGGTPGGLSPSSMVFLVDGLSSNSHTFAIYYKSDLGFGVGMNYSELLAFEL